MEWFKFYGQDYLSDPKVLALSSSERSCWITLLSYGSINDDGKITFLSEEQLMAQSGISIDHEEWDMTLGILEKLQKLKMITLDNSDDNKLITINNWNKRQGLSLTSYQRVKKHREKKRLETQVITSETASDNNRREEKRIEEKRIDKKNIDNSVKVTAVAVKKKNPYLPDVLFVYDIFKKHFGSSPKPIKAKNGFDLQYAASKRLVKVHTRPVLKKMLEFVLDYQNKDKYCRISTSPLEFEKNYNWYKTYLEQKKNKSSGGILK